MKKIKYTIVNICPKKIFYSEEALINYCNTHVVPVDNNDFIIEKSVIETKTFTRPGKVIDTSIDTELVIDLCNKIADKLSNKPEYINIGRLNEYLTVSNYKILIDILSNLKDNNIINCIDVYTDYKPCDNFAIHIDTYTEQIKKHNEEYLIKYNKEHNTNYCSIVFLPVWNTLWDKCSNLNWDLTKLNKDEIELFEWFFKPTSLYIQFRDDDIMIDPHCYTGRHVSFRQTNPNWFDKSRYEWCINCVNGNFKTY